MGRRTVKPARYKATKASERVAKPHEINPELLAFFSSEMRLACTQSVAENLWGFWRGAFEELDALKQQRLELYEKRQANAGRLSRDDKQTLMEIEAEEGLRRVVQAIRTLRLADSQEGDDKQTKLAIYPQLFISPTGGSSFPSARWQNGKEPSPSDTLEARRANMEFLIGEAQRAAAQYGLDRELANQVDVYFDVRPMAKA